MSVIIPKCSVVIDPAHPEEVAVQAHAALGTSLATILTALGTPSARGAFLAIFLARLAGQLAATHGPDAVITLFDETVGLLRKHAPGWSAPKGKPH